MGLRKTPAALAAVGAAAALAIAGCSSSSSSTSASKAGSSSSSSSSGSGSAPSQLVVWRMGGAVPTQATWLQNVATQFHQKFPQYKNTKIVLKWIPWGNRTTDWNNALTTGKNGPDVTELGNTDTPTEVGLGMLANISSDVSAWSQKSKLIPYMLQNDNQNGSYYAVPWFAGVRAVWYRKDQFTKAGISSPPTTWAQLVTDAQKLVKAYPGSFGIDAITNDTNAFASFVWGAGGQFATQSGSTWTGDLTSPKTEAAIKFYVSLYTKYHLSPAKYLGQTELGNVGATSGGANTDFALGKLDLYIDGPWAKASMPSNATDKTNWASFPIPSENGPNPAPVFGGGSDLAVFKTSKYPKAAWDLITVMDSPSNTLSFAPISGMVPPYQTSGGSYSGDAFLKGFATAMQNGKTGALSAKNWATADNGKYNIIPTMLKALMQGAPFQKTVAQANSQLTKVLNSGSES